METMVKIRCSLSFVNRSVSCGARVRNRIPRRCVAAIVVYRGKPILATDQIVYYLATYLDDRSARSAHVIGSVFWRYKIVVDLRLSLR